MIDKVLEETLSYGGKSMTLHEMRGQFCPGVWQRDMG
jgi:HTH-type transcriptional regulator/antitoxin MqsA